ncbi:MAG: peptidylprolyl isomerase [Gaiellaceae bacterium]
MRFPFRKKTLLFFACALAVGMAACGGNSDGKAAEDVPVNAIALVGDQEVPKAEYDALLDRAKQSYKAQKRPFPEVGSPEYNDLKVRAVQFLVQRYQFRSEAESLGVSATDEEVTKRLDELKETNFGGSDEKLRAELRKLGLTEEQARAEIEDKLLQEKIFKKVTGSIKVPAVEIEKYYEDNEEQFTKPREVRHIIVKSKQKAAELRKELEGGASFAALAKEFSTDKGSAKQGGKLTVSKGQTVAPFDKIAFSIDEGETSAPVKTEFGWHIIEALAPIEVTELSEAKPTIEKQLKQQKQSAAMDTWLKQTQAKYAKDVVYAVGYKPAATTTQTQSQTTG